MTMNTPSSPAAPVAATSNAVEAQASSAQANPKTGAHVAKKITAPSKTAPKKQVARPVAVKPDVKTLGNSAGKTPSKPATKPATKPVSKPAVKPTAVKKAKPAAKLPSATSTQPKVTKPAPSPAKPLKDKKVKVVRDSFTIPKTELLQIGEMKKRALTLGVGVKKSELIRAGLSALNGMTDVAFKKALASVPTIKTGRPAKD